MSFWPRLDDRALLEAAHACERLAPRLLDLLGRHEHAAALARGDWEGPHHDRFEDDALSVRHALVDGQVWVLRLRHELIAAYEARLAARMLEEQTLLTTSPR